MGLELEVPKIGSGNQGVQELLDEDRPASLPKMKKNELSHTGKRRTRIICLPQDPDHDYTSGAISRTVGQIQDQG